MYINILIKIIFVSLGSMMLIFLSKESTSYSSLGDPCLNQREIKQRATLFRLHEFPFKVGWGRRSTRKRNYLPFLVRLPKGATPSLPKIRFKRMGLNGVNLLLLFPYYSSGGRGEPVLPLQIKSKLLSSQSLKKKSRTTFYKNCVYVKLDLAFNRESCACYGEAGRSWDCRLSFSLSASCEVGDLIGPSLHLSFPPLCCLLSSWVLLRWACLWYGQAMHVVLGL